MIFRGRYDKQMNRIKEQNKGNRAYDEHHVLNIMEKNDLLAMIIAAMIVILPVALGVLLVVSAIGRFFILR